MVIQAIPLSVLDIPSKQPPGDSPYNYAHFQGANYVFCCNGRLRNTVLTRPNLGPFKVLYLPITLVLALSPLPIFAALQAEWLWRSASKALPIVFAYLWAVMYSALLRASFSDPGTLPRNIHIVDGLEQNGVPEEYHNWIMMPGPSNSKNGPSAVYAKYCPTCYIWRPVRTGHCSRCNACIANMDHHCPWISNCVAQRNYSDFVAFIFFAVVIAAFMAATAFYQVAEATALPAGPLFCGIWAVLLGLYPTVLLGGHLLLALYGITTREYFNVERHPGNSKLADIVANPFNVTFWQNLRRQCLRPRGLSDLRVISRTRAGDDRFRVVTVGKV